MNDAPWTIYAGTQHLAPCKECGDRYVGCHGACARYAEYKREHNKIKHENYERLIRERMPEEYTIVTRQRVKRRRGK